MSEGKEEAEKAQLPDSQDHRECGLKRSQTIVKNSWCHARGSRNSELRQESSTSTNLAPNAPTIHAHCGNRKAMGADPRTELEEKLQTLPSLLASAGPSKFCCIVAFLVLPASGVMTLRTSYRPLFTKISKYCFNTSYCTEIISVSTLFRRLKVLFF